MALFLSLYGSESWAKSVKRGKIKRRSFRG